MALAINGTPVSGQSSTTNIVTSPTFTTTVSNCIIIVTVGAENTTSVSSLSSVTATGLSFSLRKAFKPAATGGIQTTIEVWWALASSTFSNTISGNFASTIDDACIVVVAVSGADTVTPWDPSATSPTNSSTATSLPTVSTSLSTSNANSVLFGFAATGIAAAQAAGTIAGTTGTLDKDEQNFGATNSCATAVEHRIVSATQSNVSVAFGANYNTWVMIADAIQAPGAAASFLPDYSPWQRNPILAQ